MPGRVRTRTQTLATAARAVLLACAALALRPGGAALAQDTAGITDVQSAPPVVEDRYYFYRAFPYGSESLIHPLRMIINGGYGIMQLDNRDNLPFAIDYRTGATNVWRNISHPIASIENDGWWEFLKAEVIPVSFHAKTARYWPNYTQHLIGGGMSSRMIEEWYRYHGYPHPRAWMVATMGAYHFLNEVVENDTYVGWTTDPVADLLLFDPAGILLFTSDGVCRFFSEKLHMADWSYQPSYDPHRKALENNGQNFALKLDLPRSRHWSLFYHYGTHAEMGLSHTWDGGDCLSFGAGLKAGDLIDLDAGIRTVDLALSAGVFYDRHNSLLASLQYAGTKDYMTRLNIYPGLVRLGGFSPGFFLAVNRDDRVIAGVTLSMVPHLPVGLALTR